MKTLKIKYLSIATFIVFLLSLSFSSHAQTLAVATAVSDTVGAWGPELKVDLMNQPTVFRLKVKRHFGTTCQFVIEMTNNGTRTINSEIGFLGRGGQLYAATIGFVSIKPGERLYFDREKREVLKRGVKNDAVVCRNCDPVLGFYNLKLR